MTQNEFDQILIRAGEGTSWYYRGLSYIVGHTVRPEYRFNSNPRISCTSGIHFL